MAFSHDTTKNIKDNVYKMLSVARKPLKLRGGRPIEGRPLRMTITKECTGKWYVSVICQVEADKVPDRKNSFVGIDMGIKDFAIDSKGNRYNLPKSLAKLDEKLKATSKRFSKIVELVKKSKDDKTLQKLKQSRRRALSRIYFKINNIKKDFFHKLVNSILDKFTVIGLETLDIKNMQLNTFKSLASKMHQVSWATFFNILEYKSAKINGLVIKAGKYFPSTQIHNTCGHRSDVKVTLGTSVWTCDKCKQKVDRDENAASNLESVARYITKNIKTLPLSKPNVLKLDIREAVW